MRFKLITALLFLSGLGAHIFAADANEGYRIEVNIPSQKSTKAYLATYWNNASYAVDSVLLSDKGIGVFESEKELKEGQYMLYIPPSLQLDILIGKGQNNLKMKIDPSSLNNCTIEGSEDTKMLWNLLQKQSDYNKQRDILSKKETSDSPKIVALDSQFEEYMNEQIAKNKGTWFSSFIKGTLPIAIPYPEPKEASEVNANRKHLVEHYFDNIDFQDKRLWTTNYLSSQIDNYMQQIVHQDLDSLAEAASKLVAKTKGNESSFQFLLSRLINESVNSPVMGRENIWSRLFEDYLLGEDIQWIDSAEMSKLHMDFELMRNNRIGMTAKNMLMMSEKGEVVNTNEIDAEFLILFFYNPTCPHCKVQLPILRDQIYAKYKDKGIKIAAINIDPPTETKEWQSFIDTNKMNDWINLNDPEYKSEYWMNYDASGIPIIYVLDKEKKIIGRKVSGDNIETIINFYLNNNNGIN